MSEKLKFFLFFIQFGTIFNLVNAQCNTCGSSGIACTSETDYAVCNNGKPTSDIVATCPSYAYCDLDLVCANITATSRPSCISACGVCTPDLRYACVDINKFQMCYETNIPTSPVLTCPTGSVCDYYAAAGSFCGFIGSIPTPVCSGPYTPTTEPPIQPPTQPGTGTTVDRWSSWCRSLGLAGRFPYTLETGCKSYIYCFVNNSLLYGNYYKCSGSTVFKPTYQTCVDPASYSCPS